MSSILNLRKITKEARRRELWKLQGERSESLYGFAVPATSVLEVLSGQTAKYTGGIVDLLPVFLTCSATKNAAENRYRIKLVRRRPPDPEPGGRPSAPRGHNCPGAFSIQSLLRKEPITVKARRGRLD